eukprot:Blabericola_migrator_1__1803@NODE_148_length_12903_cov_144_651293_g129_i0_p3_GENE_NODE_148_length_12903_cov_144_651293_g129_i0NODE_148_length_12903_cov_144_651293_g129_i0_p3_ORF_typecomplete_len347_score36_60GHMP_kinases_N/PF00288_26/4_9e12GHMP_kinases_C/PF08544_13/1_2e04GHMP_kinases_C/PF08544_13/3_9e07_NODE_148_length_12903_cov_144_651293_g129_i01071811758
MHSPTSSDDSLSTTSTTTNPETAAHTIELGDSVTVRAPATSANLGCGFDSFGVAFDIWLTVSVTAAEQFAYKHVGGDEVPMDANNDVALSFMAGLRYLKAHIPPGINFAFDTETQVPIGRGLGSSAAAIVAGFAASFVMCGRSLDDPSTLDEISQLACDAEGHPDNVLPSVYGGMQIGVMASKKAEHCGPPVVRQAVPFPTSDLSCLVYVPAAVFSTKEARAILPSAYDRETVAQNIGRASIMVAALMCRNYENLKYAVQDSIHQPFRGPFCPSFALIQDKCELTHALAVYLSGAGPSTVILTKAEEAAQVQDELRAVCPPLFVGDSGTLIEACVSTKGVHQVVQV